MEMLKEIVVPFGIIQFILLVRVTSLIYWTSGSDAWSYEFSFARLSVRLSVMPFSQN